MPTFVESQTFDTRLTKSALLRDCRGSGASSTQQPDYRQFKSNYPKESWRVFFIKLKIHHLVRRSEMLSVLSSTIRCRFSSNRQNNFLSLVQHFEHTETDIRPSHVALIFSHWAEVSGGNSFPSLHHLCFHTHSTHSNSALFCWFPLHF